MTGRQQFYQDHEWMRTLVKRCVYKPPINLKTTSPVMNSKPNGNNKEILLNWITPHQKWGSTVPTRQSAHADPVTRGRLSG